MKNQFFVLSDVHGCFDALQQAVANWQPEHETLVVLGDLVDRGPDSLAVVRLLMDLCAVHGDNVQVVKGNHDQAFAEWALLSDAEDFSFTYKHSHDETMRSFYLDDPKGNKRFKKASKRQRGEHMRRNFRAELQFLLSRQLFVETEHLLFVHAGVNLYRPDWWLDTNAMLSVREAFYKNDTPAPLVTFFGHTPTKLLREDRCEPGAGNAPWFSPCGTKVGLDGGACFTGGELNALRVSETGDVLETFAFEERNKVTTW